MSHHKNINCRGRCTIHSRIKKVPWRPSIPLLVCFWPQNADISHTLYWRSESVKLEPSTVVLLETPPERQMKHARPKRCTFPPMKRTLPKQKAPKILNHCTSIINHAPATRRMISASKITPKAPKLPIDPSASSSALTRTFKNRPCHDYQIVKRSRSCNNFQ